LQEMTEWSHQIPGRVQNRAFTAPILETLPFEPAYVVPVFSDLSIYWVMEDRSQTELALSRHLSAITPQNE